MKLGLKRRLFVSSLLLVLTIDLAVGFFLEWRLRRTLTARIDDELGRVVGLARAALVAELATVHPPSGVPGSPALDSAGAGADVAPELGRAQKILAELGETARARLRLVGGDGKVVADSGLDVRALPYLDDASERPEVREALAGGVGRARRYATVAQTHELHVAVPVQVGGVRRALAGSIALDELDAAVAQVRWTLVLAGLLALAGAAAFGAIASMTLGRALRGIVNAAQEIRAGEGSETGEFQLDRSEVDSLPQLEELGGLAGSLNRMARELEQTMATLADERNRFEAVLQSMHDAVIAIDGDRQVTLVNRSAMALLGFTATMQGRNLLEATRIPELQDLLDEARAGAPSTREFSLTAGRERTVLARANPHAGGGVVIVLQDVTDIRRLETMRRDFVANVSHELRTPVSIIRANAETLVSGAMDDPVHARRFLDGLVRSADRLGRLIADLLDISRIEAGRYAIDLQPVSALGLAAHVVESVESKAEARGTTVRVDSSADLLVMADPKALEQVLVNLVENAIKYTPERGHVEVRVREPGPGWVRLEVADDGPGIEARHRPRVFERFYRIDPGRSRDMGGTGLGLSIVKHLVDAMGGEVGLEPNVPHGSVFWCLLRRASAEDLERTGDDGEDDPDDPAGDDGVHGAPKPPGAREVAGERGRGSGAGASGGGSPTAQGVRGGIAVPTTRHRSATTT